MDNFIKRQENYIKKCLEELGYKVDEVSLVPSSRKDLGDYQYNGIMKLAKENHQNPREIASLLVDKLTNNSNFSNINVAGPGFINLSFSKESLISYMNEIIGNISLNMNHYPKKKVVIDFGGANVAKVLHVGHLRSANIGEALRRLALAVGYEVIGDVHLGDFGRPLGMVILELKTRHPEWIYFDENYTGEYPKESPITNTDLEELYPIATSKAKENEEIMEEARKITTLMQQGHRAYEALRKHITSVSIEGIKKAYDKLNANFDYWYGESDAYPYMQDVLRILEEKKLLTDSQGAKVVFVGEDDDKVEIPPFMLIKSNGSISYEATDLGTILQRMQDFNPDEIWYLVDNRQALHFTQTFRTAYKSGIVPEGRKLDFIGFGTMNGTDGKPFKTRDGGVMSLSSLMEMVREETLTKFKDNVTAEEREKLADIISIAALKYADLVPYRMTDYVFDPVKFCDMNGKTGPYLLYSTVRIKSLLKKSGEVDFEFKEFYNNLDKDIILLLLSMPRIIDKALEEKSLNEIADYLYQLNNCYNNFYAECPILIENDEIKKKSWLALSKIVLDTNLFLLDILGIQVPDKM